MFDVGLQERVRKIICVFIIFIILVFVFPAHALFFFNLEKGDVSKRAIFFFFFFWYYFCKPARENYSIKVFASHWKPSCDILPVTLTCDMF